ncbi:MAG: hypothetical protein M3Q29_09850 [Chloroflexota bacterium]|nr:hypothetical protein [Chloroflexota bacterium]
MVAMYALARITALFVAAAIGVVFSVTRQSTATDLGAASADSVMIPSFTPTGTARDAAIKTGCYWAAGFCEQNPVLIDAFLTTYSDARNRLRESDDKPPDGPLPGKRPVPDDAKVWLVRMGGKLCIPRGPGPADASWKRKRHPAWMSAVINAETGRTIQYGTHGPHFPIR